ncbi:TetR/AcrR family transcriptional regulator [Kaistia granuli]|uniref:TetR/AcrR family transcriptional regulator n=1 Tax=Kaistia granuli TaxID=363259 RepID=UPI001FE0DA32|nr:TetR/AcrR family transcriptional regulator [Kaistia granuli]
MAAIEGTGTAGREADTRERLIKAALRVFADRGIASATLREITEEAGANVAAVNYYFRSKEELTRTVLETCLRPINENRLRSLESLVAEHGDRPVPLEDLVEALVRPMVVNSLDDSGGRSPIRLILQVRALPQPLTNTILADQFDRIHRAFLAALGPALPGLTRSELALRYDFARGSIMQILGDLDPAARDLPDLAIQHAGLDNEDIIRQLVAFIAAGFRAPAFSPR